MPEMDGLEFLRIIRENGCNVSFIMFTGRGREEVAMQALNLGANRYLMKSDDTKSMYGELAHAIEQLVQRKLLEEKLRRAEERFRLMFEYAPIGYQSLNMDGDILTVSKGWLKMLGYEKNEVIGHNFSEFIDLNGKEKFKSKFPLFKTKGRIRGIDYLMQRKNGVYLPVVFEGRVQFDDDGNFKRTHCVFFKATQGEVEEDITKKEEPKNEQENE
ncbi:MAG: PAS domain S-box protein [Candidatus Hodarchaeales archaeon]|jgi:PAS domain S-box-containing protein